MKLISGRTAILLIALCFAEMALISYFSDDLSKNESAMDMAFGLLILTAACAALVSGLAVRKVVARKVDQLHKSTKLRKGD